VETRCNSLTADDCIQFFATSRSIGLNLATTRLKPSLRHVDGRWVYQAEEMARAEVLAANQWSAGLDFYANKNCHGHLQQLADAMCVS